MKNKLLVFWKIGQFIDESKISCENIYKKYSELCSYHYGMSEVFARSNVRCMNKFYCAFPIYYKSLEGLCWEHYLLLINIIDREVRYFYYRVALFCRSSVKELVCLIDNDYYNLLQKEDIIY